jgi:serine/threonine-protein kinase HipA
LGLLPEGWYLDLASKKLKIDKDDKFGLLLATCKDTVGAVSIRQAV